MTFQISNDVYASSIAKPYGDGSYRAPFKTLAEALALYKTARVAINDAILDCGCKTQHITALVDISGRGGPRDVVERCEIALSHLQFVVECECCGATWNPGPDVGQTMRNKIVMQAVTVKPLARPGEGR